MSNQHKRNITVEKDFGELIHTARVESGLSTRAVTSAIKKRRGPDVSPAYLNLLEKNKRTPTLSAAYALGAVLSIPTEIVLKAAYRARIERCVEKETASLARFSAATQSETS